MKEYTIRTYDMEDYENVRDSMTPNDIADYLAYINRGYVPDYNFTGYEDDFERYKLHIAISKAIEIIRNKAEGENEEKI